MGYVYAVSISLVLGFASGYGLAKWRQIRAAARQIGDTAAAVVRD